MKHIKNCMEIIMNSEKNDSILSFFLYVLSLLYGAVLKLRAVLYKTMILRSERLPCKVISVGNITAGGTGKTPMTVWLAEMLHSQGIRPVIISRGYKGKAEKAGGIVSNGREILMNSEDSGDEPFMMAERLKNIPVIVGRNRIKSANLAIRLFNPDVILLDDGFQHLKLRRDINIVLMDSKSPFGNTHVMPRGMLREPLSALLRGDIFIFTRCNISAMIPKNRLKKIISDKPIFTSYHSPYIYKIINKENTNSQADIRGADIRKNRAVAFSGIAKNEDFLKTVKGFGCSIVRNFGYPDHHSYSIEDVNTITDAVKKAHADILITTEKDYARMGKNISWPVPLVVIGINISINEKTGFCKLIL